MLLESIRNLVKTDLEATNQFIYTELKSNIPLINELMEYVLSCGGKRIRPMLVLLAARAFNHQHQQHIHLAAAIELIHTATLLHDDVVDHASLRRGRQTANTIWGNQTSVLVGDFLYSRAFQLIVSLQHIEIIGIFSNATNLIAEGEVMQLINCHNPDTTESSYFDVIERKTAKLFEIACQAGAALSNCTPEQVAAMKDYGKYLGIAYQLMDDVLDYTASTEEMGKNIGNDLAEGKPTLPILYALQHSSAKEITLLRKAIESGSEKNANKIITIVTSSGAIEYTTQIARQYAEQANKALTSAPNSPYRKALQELTEFVVERVS
jgi:octaprenyl-diphosphate synthase